jgi:hypothetical protein
MIVQPEVKMKALVCAVALAIAVFPTVARTRTGDPGRD